MSGSHGFDEEFWVDSSEQGGGLGPPQPWGPVAFLPASLLRFSALFIRHVRSNLLLGDYVMKISDLWTTVSLRTPPSLKVKDEGEESEE